MADLYLRDGEGNFVPVPSLKGTDGVDGGYYAPSVSEDGELNWTPSKEDMPSVPSANIKGKDGKDARDGP